MAALDCIHMYTLLNKFELEEAINMGTSTPQL